MILHVDVVNKIATYQKRGGCIVCGNSDYYIQFSFDREWDAHDRKTARFIYNGQFIDVDFSKTEDNNLCTVPILSDTTEVEVGVYAGELKTTTSAFIGCYRSILCEVAKPSAENDRLHINEAKEAADRAEEAAKIAEEYAGKVITEGGGISAEVDGRLETLEQWMECEGITASLSVSPSTAEVGQSVTNARLTWSVSKPTKNVKIDGVSVDDTPYTDKKSYTANKTWTLQATATDGGATATTTLTFQHRVYWGIGTTESGFESAFVKALAHSELTTSKAITLNVAPDTQYIYYAVPKALCDTEPIFVMDDGFAGGFGHKDKEEIVVTNAYGAEIVYYVYRSDQLLVGSTRVDVS